MDTQTCPLTFGSREYRNYIVFSVSTNVNNILKYINILNIYVIKNYVYELVSWVCLYIYNICCIRFRLYYPILM